MEAAVCERSNREVIYCFGTGGSGLFGGAEAMVSILKLGPV
jgi:hypothetical protein